MPNKILLIEDDDGIALPLVRTFEREGYVVTRCADGQSGIDQATSGRFDLMLLDLGLPDMDGLEVCRRVREDGYSAGIMILTARGGELDRVVGLDVGADDYMEKPFSLAELLARARALLRRSTAAGPRQSGNGPDVHAVTNGLVVDVQSRTAVSGGVSLPLTAKEFDVLALLVANRRAVVTREHLMDSVWDSNWFGSTKTLDVTIGRLRQKLDEAGSTAQVVTLRGVGFRIDDGSPDA